ncbi:MAG: dihydroneopterin aldolase, partial [Lysobacterales bacterium]
MSGQSPAPGATVSRIFIDGLIVPAVIGIHDHEQAGPQRLRIDAQLCFDASGAAGDDIGGTVDYAAVVELIESVCRDNTRLLLESLSTQLLDALFARFPLLGVDL